jgi:hypothetical protein
MAASPPDTLFIPPVEATAGDPPPLGDLAMYLLRQLVGIVKRCAEMELNPQPEPKPKPVEVLALDSEDSSDDSVAVPEEPPECSTPEPTFKTQPLELLVQLVQAIDSPQVSDLPPIPVSPAKTPFRESSGLSIDNYNPSVRTTFTDPLTLEACANLGIDPDHLFYPTNRMLYNYTRDKDMQEVVRRRLIERAERFRETVRIERDRIACRPPTPPLMDEEQMKYCLRQQLAYEDGHIERTREINRREAERVILDILIENEAIEESLQKQERETLRLRQLEAERELKKKEDYDIQIAKIRAARRADPAESDAEQARRAQLEERSRKADEKREQIEQNKRKYYAMLAEERAQKNERARMAITLCEEQRRQEYEQARKAQDDKNKLFQERYVRKQQERMLRFRIQTQKDSERIAQVKLAQQAITEQKRETAEVKLEERNAGVARVLAIRNREIETLRLQSAMKLASKTTYREQLLQRQQEEKEAKHYAREQRSEQYHIAGVAQADRSRRELALQRVIHLEDRRAASSYMQKRREAELREADVVYEARCKALDDQHAQKLQQQEMAEMKRASLERMKADLVSGALSPSEIRAKGLSQLKSLTAELGIDFDALQERAKQYARSAAETSA